MVHGAHKARHCLPRTDLARREGDDRLVGEVDLIWRRLLEPLPRRGSGELDGERVAEAAVTTNMVVVCKRETPMIVDEGVCRLGVCTYPGRPWTLGGAS